VTAVGDTFRMPDGTIFVVQRPAAESSDGATSLEVSIPAEAFAPPPHRHPDATDSFEEGTFSVMVDGDWRELGPGERVDVPPNTMHTLANRSGKPVRVRSVHRPANRFEAFLEHVDVLMRARGVKTAKDVRVPLLFSMLTLEYDDTLVPARRRDIAMTRTMAAVGRLVGLSTQVQR
jgi:mannose-6-phosphate isomerase-like protein (cupin superfamily)